MQIPTKTELVSFDGWTLRVRASDDSHPRLLLLIHGWTGDENSMWVFTRALSPAYWMIAPHAPHPADPGGFSWRISLSSSFGRPSLDALQPSAAALIKLVDEYSAAVDINPAQFDVVGFSQGAAMVNVLGMLYPQRVRRMGVLAGFMPSGMEELIARKPLAGKDVFVAHGAHDETIPIDRARASVELMEQAGARIIYCEGDVGHKLSANCLRALEDYLKD